MFAKWSILRSLRIIERRLATFDVRTTSIEEVESWQRQAEDLFLEVYKHHSYYVDKLQDIRCSVLVPPGISVVHSDGVISSSAEPPVSERIQKYKELAFRILDNARQDLHRNGLPTSYRWPLRRVIWGHIISFLTPLSLMLISWWLGFIQVGGGQEANSLEAQVLLSDFRNWHEANTLAFKPGWDSILQDFASRGVLESGITVKALMDYSESYRRRRDNTIDSFLVRLQAAGVDTDTLKVDRKLPMRVGAALAPWEERLGLDVGALGQLRVLDTL